MRILITGCSGYIGGVLARELAGREHEVLGADRRPYRGDAVERFVRGDLCDPEVAEEAVRGSECVFHLAAARTDWGVSEKEYFRDNVEATRRVIVAGAEQGVDRWYFYSSVAAMGTGAKPPDESADLAPEGAYGRSKAAAERLFRDLARQGSGRQVVILRPSAVYGPENPEDTNVYRLIDAIYRGRFVMVGDGDTRKTTSYIENLVAATLFLFDRMSPGVDTFLYVDEPVLRTEELVDWIHRMLGREPPTFRVPEKAAVAVGRALDVAAGLFSVDLPITGSRIEKFCRETNFDAGAIRRAGFEQPVDNWEALRRTVEWYLAEVGSGQRRGRARARAAAGD